MNGVFPSSQGEAMAMYFAMNFARDLSLRLIPRSKGLPTGPPSPPVDPTSFGRLFAVSPSSSSGAFFPFIFFYVLCLVAENFKEKRRESQIVELRGCLANLETGSDKECGYAGAIELCKQLHGYILKNGFAMFLALATALVDMYGKCGGSRNARALFDSLENRDVMAWTAMISAYAQADFINQAFNLFVQLRSIGIRPNEVTMVSRLGPCVEAGSLDVGMWFHAYIGWK
ncbi:hypothetical protein L1049_026646 [Liquidambar formosana]|uniref:Pentatricopeptide repeat-containing protein n=1 Tax=Liquidambar formosana TaxID=63359 RepID=A0AAP0NF96_LIQFO